MPLFGRKKEEPPPPPAKPNWMLHPEEPEHLPEPLRTLAIELRDKLLGRLEQEKQALEKLGIPIPRQTAPLRIRANWKLESKELVEFTIKRPQYEQSLQLYFAVESSTNNEELAIYFINREQQQKPKGIWLNRHPYRFYYAITNLPHSVRVSQPQAVNIPDVPPLEVITQAPEISSDQLRAFERSILFFVTWAYGRDIGKIRKGSESYYPLDRRPDSLASSFGTKALQITQLPATELPKETGAIKILPSLADKPGSSKQFLSNLHAASHPIIYTIASQGEQPYLQMTFAKQDQALIERQLQIHFPYAAVLPSQPLTRPAGRVFILEAHPTDPFATFRIEKEFSLDPYSQLFALLAERPAGEHTFFNVIFTPIPTQGLSGIIEYYNRYTEKKGDLLARKMPAWAISIKVYSQNRQALEQIASAFLSQYETQEQKWATTTSDLSALDLSCRSETAVSTDELASFAHMPSKEVLTQIETTSNKAVLPPESFTTGEVLIGESEARGQRKPVTIPDSIRDRHTYVVGKSGTGKSTLVFNIARQDIERGEGVCVIDPHGDLVKDLLDHIPEERIEDTIYFNLEDKEHPIGLNIFNAENDEEVELLTDDLLVTFKRLTESWGDRMETILRYTFNTLLRAPEASFLDIATFLQNPQYRARIVRQINFAPLTDYWENQFANYPKDAAQPILNRMSKFVLSRTLASILSQTEATLSFQDVIENKKILLVNLSGQIGAENAKLLGSLFVSQLQLAVMRRASMAREQRHPFYLFVDEFQNFTTSAFQKILSEARKYKLCLTIANQYTSQLEDSLRDAILGNVGTIVMFELFEKDANYLRSQLGTFDPQDLTQLQSTRHEALCKPATGSRDTFKFTTLAPPPRPQSYAREIIEYTRENYSSSSQEPIPEAAPRPEKQPQRPLEGAQEPAKPILEAKPAAALPKEFETTRDKILHFIAQAEYLSTPQIIKLCYQDLAESARAPVASRDLKKLIESKNLKSQPFGKSKIYFSGRTPNVTTHNLAVRDLFVKIALSDYEIAEVRFFYDLNNLAPDLFVSFQAEDGSLIKTFWEYDTGTEGIAELMKKVQRYSSYNHDSHITFVFSSPERQAQVGRSIKEKFIKFAVLDSFERLKDASFSRASNSEARPFFDS